MTLSDSLKPYKLFAMLHVVTEGTIELYRMTRNSPTSPVLRSHQQFSWEKILSGNPEKRPLKKPPKAVTKPEALAVAVHRAKQRVQAVVPEEPEPTVPRQPVPDNSLSNPTPAMLEIISRMRQRASTPALAGGKKSKSER